MKASDIRELSDEALVHQELDLERQLIAAKFHHSMQQLEDTAQIGKLRKEIARLHTETRNREKALGVAKNSLRDQHRRTFGANEAQEAAADAGQEEAKGGFLRGIVDRFSGKE